MELGSLVDMEEQDFGWPNELPLFNKPFLDAMKDRDLYSDAGTVVYLEFSMQELEEYRKLKEVDDEFLNTMYTFRINVRICDHSRPTCTSKRSSTETSSTSFTGIEFSPPFKNV